MAEALQSMVGLSCLQHHVCNLRRKLIRMKFSPILLHPPPRDRYDLCPPREASTAAHLLRRLRLGRMGSAAAATPKSSGLSSFSHERAFKSFSFFRYRVYLLMYIYPISVHISSYFPTSEIENLSIGGACLTSWGVLSGGNMAGIGSWLWIFLLGCSLASWCVFEGTRYFSFVIAKNDFFRSLPLKLLVRPIFYFKIFKLLMFIVNTTVHTHKFYIVLPFTLCMAQENKR